METHRPEKAAVLIARQIISDVARRGLRPGDFLPAERTMVETYGAGRGTIREALRLLEFQGVISLKPGPGGGPILQDPSGAHLATTMVLLLQMKQAPFRAIVEVRQAVEPMISRLAAEHMSDKSLGQLEESVSSMRENLDDRTMFLESNKQFHDIIAWSSGNALFGYLVDSLIGIMHGTGIGIDYPKFRREAILVAHQEILESLRARDPVSSEEHMRDHIAAYVTYAEKKYRDVMDHVIRWDRPS
jgi:GntR family transcriptional regulator, transcriptional repressor for pyruvate dehydrogenase complex